MCSPTGKYSIYLHFFPQFLHPLYKMSTFCRNLGLLNCLQVQSAVLIKTSCLAGYTIQYNFCWIFTSCFMLASFFPSAAFCVLVEGLIKKKLCIISGSCFVSFCFFMMLKNCRFLCFVISVALMLQCTDILAVSIKISNT